MTIFFFSACADHDKRFDIALTPDGGGCIKTSDCVAGSTCEDKFCKIIVATSESAVAAIGRGCATNNDCTADLGLTSEYRTTVENCCTGQQTDDCEGIGIACCAGRSTSGTKPGLCVGVVPVNKSSTLCPPSGNPASLIAAVDETTTCGLSSDCCVGWTCNGAGHCARFFNGSGDDHLERLAQGLANVDELCVEEADCKRPFLCDMSKEPGPERVCVKLPEFYLGPTRVIPDFHGDAPCLRSEYEVGRFRAYFEVPDLEKEAAAAVAVRAQTATDEQKDLFGNYEFYRLPFPSDIRVKDGKIHVSDMHPSPGVILGLDLRQTYLGGVENDAKDFSLASPIFLRFSDLIDVGTLCLDQNSTWDAEVKKPETYCSPTPKPVSLFLVDITSDPQTFNTHVPIEVNHQDAQGQYICQNWIGMIPKVGVALYPGHTYAAVATTQIRPRFGKTKEIVQDPDLVAVLRDTVPTEERLKHAHTQMAPFRTWLQDNGVYAASDIAAAAVFTTTDPRPEVVALEDAVDAVAVSNANWNGSDNAKKNVNCDLSPPSPCDVAGVTPTRGCTGSFDGFTEYQGKFTAPVWQQGSRPYRSAGGNIVRQSNGSIGAPQGTEDICFSMMVPDGLPPSGGWPVVIYAHGTGGNYRSVVGDAVEIVKQGYVAIGYDNVMHGPRSGLVSTKWADEDPGSLFFNIRSPRAARDNVLQGAADIMHLQKLLKATTNFGGALGQSSFLNSNSILGPLSLNTSKINLFAHSQGAVVAAPYLPRAQFNRVVLTGAGADLILSILTKQKPSELKNAVSAVFSDGAVSRIHPMMGMLSHLFAPVDSLSHARFFTEKRASGVGSYSYLHILGNLDNYVPTPTQQALVDASSTPLICGPANQSPREDPPGCDGASFLQSNYSRNDLTLTRGGSVFNPLTSGSAIETEGHFVFQYVLAAKNMLKNFFTTADTSPKITR